MKTIFVMGNTNSGKSSSLRTLDPKSTFIIAPNQKDLAFPGSRENYTLMTKTNMGGNLMRKENLTDIKPVITHVATKRPEIKVLVLEDFSHFLTHRAVSKSFNEDEGYGKWGTLGSDVYDALFADLETLRDDLTLIVIHHTEVKDDGTIAEFTLGKMMDTKIKILSWYDIVLHSIVVETDGGRKYRMLTQQRGQRLAKSPVGMFPSDDVSNNMAKILIEVEAYYAGKSTHKVEFIDD